MEINKHSLDIVAKFVAHCVSELKLKSDVNLKLLLEQQGVPTAGTYDPMNGIVKVSVKNRAIADCLRTIAHELTHQQQKESGVEFPENDEDLQKYEDEANVMAGRLVRFYGRKHKEIYGDLA